MRYPNLRYGDPAAMEYYATGIPRDELARQLRRSERSVKDWLEGKSRMPWWIPEIMRLWKMERELVARQMGYHMALPKALRVVRTGAVLDFPKLKPKAPDEPASIFPPLETFLTGRT